MPIAVILEYMHLCLEGFGKRQLIYFFDSQYHTAPFYLNSKIQEIDRIFKTIKYIYISIFNSINLQ